MLALPNETQDDCTHTNSDKDRRRHTHCSDGVEPNRNPGMKRQSVDCRLSCSIPTSLSQKGNRFNGDGHPLLKKKRKKTKKCPKKFDFNKAQNSMSSATDIREQEKRAPFRTITQRKPKLLIIYVSIKRRCVCGFVTIFFHSQYYGKPL